MVPHVKMMRRVTMKKRRKKQKRISQTILAFQAAVGHGMVVVVVAAPAAEVVDHLTQYRLLAERRAEELIRRLGRRNDRRWC